MLVEPGVDEPEMNLIKCIVEQLAYCPPQLDMKMWKAIAELNPKHCYFVGVSFDAYEFGKAVGIAIPKDE